MARCAVAMVVKYRSVFLALIAVAVFVNLLGINTGFFTDDPGLYGSIAKSMLYRHDWLQLFTYNTDWLDKPHFPFWAAALSFKIFGISSWAYRLPALLCFLLSLWYTYLFARKYYNDEVALTAVLIVLTSQHVILSNTDVRAEPYLMAFIIGAIYHISVLAKQFNWRDLLLGALLTAFAIMTKGIFVIVPIFGALLGDLVFTVRFKELFAGRWWLLYLLTFIFCLPELYALYIQFDVHPQKLVFDRHDVSGIRWFLWDSQFGRFANNGPIKQAKSGDVFFYLHTLLWAFLPWCLLFYYGVGASVKHVISKLKLPEYYTLSGGILLVLLFSLSRFQLPFYTNILFPLFAIVTAPYCFKALSKVGEGIRKGSLWLFITALPLLIITIHVFLKPDSSSGFIIAVVIFAAIVFAVLRIVKERTYRTFFLAATAVLFANFYLNATVFPMLAGYNGQIAAAQFGNQSEFKYQRIYSLRMSNNVFQFYADRPVDFVAMEDFKKFDPKGPALFFVSKQTKEYLEQSQAKFRVIRSFVNYPQENLLPKFINSATRQQVLDEVYLISK